MEIRQRILAFVLVIAILLVTLNTTVPVNAEEIPEEIGIPEDLIESIIIMEDGSITIYLKSDYVYLGGADSDIVPIIDEGVLQRESEAYWSQYIVSVVLSTAIDYKQWRGNPTTIAIAIPLKKTILIIYITIPAGDAYIVAVVVLEGLYDLTRGKYVTIALRYTVREKHYSSWFESFTWRYSLQTFSNISDAINAVCPGRPSHWVTIYSGVFSPRVRGRHCILGVFCSENDYGPLVANATATLPCWTLV